MALSRCLPTSTDAKGRELVEHGTALFPVACYHDDLEKMEVAWHWHEELEVLVVERGTARISVNGTDYLVKQGEGFFINTGILHGAWQAGAEPCRVHSIVFHPRYVGGSVDSILWQKYLESLLTDSSRPCVFFSNTAPWEATTVKAIETAWQLCVSEAEGFEFLTRESLSQIIFLLFQNRPSAGNALPEKVMRDGKRTKSMLQYIQAHYSEEISLLQIAESAHICKSECLRCFRSVIGCSPIQYVKQVRIQKAVELLLGTNQKISDIGLQCGFQEMSYFAKVFREVKGCTPRVFREQLCSNTKQERIELL